MYLATLTPKFAFKNPALKATGEFGSFEHELPVLLASCLANKCCTFLHHNAVSVDWLSCVTGEWTQVWFGNISTLSDMKQNSLHAMYAVSIFIFMPKGKSNWNEEHANSYWLLLTWLCSYISSRKWLSYKSGSSNRKESCCIILASIVFYWEKNYTSIFHSTLFPRKIGGFSPSGGHWRQHNCFPWCEAGVILPPW